MKQRTFKNQEVLERMLYLRLQGWSLKELAFRFDCDHTSIRKACIRNGLPKEILLLPHPMIVFKQVYTDWTGERMSQGKSYKEYLQEQEERKRHTRLRLYRSTITS